MTLTGIGRARSALAFGTALLVLAAAGAASAQIAGFPSPDAPPPAPTAPTRHYVSDAALAQMFTAFCLKAFPDAPAVDAALKTRSQAQMTSEQAQPYLPDGPGRGWLVRTSDSLFALTLEDPPNHTCAVQQMTPDGVRDVGGLIQAIKAHVVAMKGKLVAVAPQKATRTDGPDVRYFGYGVLTSDNTPVEQFGVYVSDYKGKAPEPWGPYASPGSGVEVRFTRTILAG
ncbi:MAG TPA: hypothetical protein VIJ94_09770 [Caulobacteraceae bacterium]